MSESATPWEVLVEKVTINDLVKAYQQPAAFQVALAELITQYAQSFPTPSVAEVGSAFGVTTALLPVTYQKTLMDLSAPILARAEEFYKAIDQPVKTYARDILHDDATAPQFDIVYSAGLLEHFSQQERQQALIQLSAMTAPDGFLIIAVPNHNSLPYRVGYLTRLWSRQWYFPEENAVGSLTRELRGCPELQLIATQALDKENAFHFLYPSLMRLFRLLDRVCHFDGYLQVFVLQKRLVGQAQV